MLTVLLVLLLLAGIPYVSVSIWIGITVNRIVDYANMGEDCYPLVADQVSEELFRRWIASIFQKERRKIS